MTHFLFSSFAPSATNVMASAMRGADAAGCGPAQCSVQPWCHVASPCSMLPSRVGGAEIVAKGFRGEGVKAA